MNCYSSISLKCFPRNVTLLGGGGFTGALAVNRYYAQHSLQLLLHTFRSCFPLESWGSWWSHYRLIYVFFHHRALKNTKQKQITTEHRHTSSLFICRLDSVKVCGQDVTGSGWLSVKYDLTNFSLYSNNHCNGFNFPLHQFSYIFKLRTTTVRYFLKPSLFCFN